MRKHQRAPSSRGRCPLCATVEYYHQMVARLRGWFHLKLAKRKKRGREKRVLET